MPTCSSVTPFFFVSADLRFSAFLPALLPAPAMGNSTTSPAGCFPVGCWGAAGTLLQAGLVLPAGRVPAAGLTLAAAVHAARALLPALLFLNAAPLVTSPALAASAAALSLPSPSSSDSDPAFVCVLLLPSDASLAAKLALSAELALSADVPKEVPLLSIGLLDKGSESSTADAESAPPSCWLPARAANEQERST